MKQTLTWQPFTPDNRPPKTTCFYTDGVATYWAGWYSSDEGVCLYVPAGDGTNRRMTDEEFARIAWWAHPGNFIANVSGGQLS